MHKCQLHMLLLPKQLLSFCKRLKSHVIRKNRGEGTYFVLFLCFCPCFQSFTGNSACNGMTCSPGAFGTPGVCVHFAWERGLLNLKWFQYCMNKNCRSNKFFRLSLYVLPFRNFWSFIRSKNTTCLIFLLHKYRKLSEVGLLSCHGKAMFVKHMWSIHKWVVKLQCEPSKVEWYIHFPKVTWFMYVFLQVNTSITTDRFSCPWLQAALSAQSAVQDHIFPPLVRVVCSKFMVVWSKSNCVWKQEPATAQYAVLELLLHLVPLFIAVNYIRHTYNLNANCLPKHYCKQDCKYGSNHFKFPWIIPCIIKGTVLYTSSTIHSVQYDV